MAGGGGWSAGEKRSVQVISYMFWTGRGRAGSPRQGNRGSVVPQTASNTPSSRPGGRDGAGGGLPGRLEEQASEGWCGAGWERDRGSRGPGLGAGETRAVTGSATHPVTVGRSCQAWSPPREARQRTRWKQGLPLTRLVWQVLLNQGQGHTGSKLQQRACGGRQLHSPAPSALAWLRLHKPLARRL